MKKYLVFDVGATRIKEGILNGEGEILEKVTVDTPAVYEDFLETLKRRIAGTPSDAVVLAFPGVFDKRLGKLLYAPNLEGLTGRCVIKDLAFKDRCIFAENDANLAALGEYHKGFDIKPEALMFLTLGTGIGGGFINAGHLFSGQTTVMEIGHMTLVADGRRCNCGKRGCFEKYCSTDALTTYYLEGSGEALSVEEIVRRADEGDFAAFAAFEMFGLHLAHGIASLINIFNPAAVRVGGGLSELARHYFPQTLELLDDMIFVPYRGKADIRIAALKNDAALTGGAVWAEDLLR
jgi:glucokinase